MELSEYISRFFVVVVRSLCFLAEISVISTFEDHITFDAFKMRNGGAYDGTW